MRVRAHRSLRAAFQFLGGKAKWDFLRTESTPLRIIGPFTVGGITASAGQVSAGAPTDHGFQVDDLIVGSGFMTGTRISATGTNSIGLTTAITGFTAGATVVTATATRDMYPLPADQRNGYSMRLLNSGRVVRYANRRALDRTITSENSPSDVFWYDFFMVGAKGKLRLFSPPSGTDVLFQRYYRRFFLASASSISTALDIPEDYEEVPIAWAKWHFLTDKNDRSEQAQTWFALAKEGIVTMLAEQVTIPDEDLMFLPGASGGYFGDNSTLQIPWEYS